MLKKSVMKKVDYPRKPEIEGCYTGIFTVEKLEHKSILVLHIFNNEKPYMQVFFEKDMFHTFMADGKYSKKELDAILKYNLCHLCILKDKAFHHAKAFFESNGLNEKDMCSFISRWQSRTKRKFLFEEKKIKAKKEWKKAVPDMRHFRKIDINAYNKKIRKTVFRDVAFLFFDKSNSTGYCNVCNSHAIALPKNRMKHNLSSECPICHASVQMKNLSVGRGKLNYVRWSVKVERHEKNLMIRYFRHIWELNRDFTNQEIETNEMMRSFLDGESLFRRDYSHIYDPYMKKCCWTTFKEVRGVMWNEPSEYAWPRNIYLYNSVVDVKRKIALTGYKYSGAAEYFESYLDERGYSPYPFFIATYMDYWKEHPQIEKLSKVGFSNIVKTLIHTYSKYGFGTEINLSEAAIYQILRISKEQFKWLLKIGNPSTFDVTFLQKHKNVSEKDFFMLRSFPDYEKNANEYMICKKYASLHKISRYLQSQSQNSDGRYYRDYLEMAESLGYDMKNSFILYPKDFTQRHDLYVEEKRLKKEKEDRERVEAYNRELAKFVEENRKVLEDCKYDKVKAKKFLMIGDLLIRLPHNVDEIRAEGEALHHCVGGYVKRVLDKETEIFFIRKVSEPDKPFFTLEWQNNKVVQCRGYKNCAETPEVGAFVNTFTGLMNNGTINVA